MCSRVASRAELGVCLTSSLSDGVLDEAPMPPE